jgi:hypothetical protein
MKRLIGSLVLVVTLSAGSAAHGAEISGTIKEGTSFLKGVQVRVQCGDKAATGTTDEYGAFKLSALGTGACQLSTDYKGAAPLAITLSSSPVRYDLVVESHGGTTTLVRQ